MSKKNRFKFADDGPGGAIVIRNFIMIYRDEAEAHIAVEGTVEESAKRHSFGIRLLEHSKMCVLCASLQTISIKFGLE